ncbi:polysaccharide deacetylase family protein [Leptolyngbya sp. FACHB-711]|uniref:polysaccharide deacetylase family protein n=1 Tax=unclassified Leptolyngbya TaxID=2650499 RepID=UPI0016830C22|nr:polysaccharide deacetylase family protein [Leptolyngbya sp. FACHB-711]MBD1850790.1 polysaccharide deacetylase family protein [Cyanobacteria bacterium FACHB-502]MBD2028092.1 polysaccharide deacetylase family protein [Leptolyngbya sp. FACHB-711]
MQFAPLYPILHKVLYPAFPACLWQGSTDSPWIALTFDDGPHPQHTLQVLEVLDRYQIKASFFWLGLLVERFPEVARTVWQAGHGVAIHGYDHTMFTQMRLPQLKQSLDCTQQIIGETCGLDPSATAQIRDVRPPNGVFTPKILSALQQWNYRPVMWSVVPEDWTRPGVSIAAQRVLTQSRNGSVIVLHDGYTGGEDAAATVDYFIPQLLDRGYQFVTIDRLWQQCQGQV